MTALLLARVASPESPHGAREVCCASRYDDRGSTSLAFQENSQPLRKNRCSRSPEPTSRCSRPAGRSPLARSLRSCVGRSSPRQSPRARIRGRRLARLLSLAELIDVARVRFAACALLLALVVASTAP